MAASNHTGSLFSGMLGVSAVFHNSTGQEIREHLRLILFIILLPLGSPRFQVFSYKLAQIFYFFGRLLPKVLKRIGIKSSP